jgi:hypothetical protein
MGFPGCPARRLWLQVFLDLARCDLRGSDRRLDNIAGRYPPLGPLGIPRSIRQCSDWTQQRYMLGGFSASTEERPNLDMGRLAS